MLATLAVVAVGLTLSALAQGTPDLSTSTKTASKTKVFPEEVVTYTITLSNTGTVSASVMVTDAIPYGTTYVTGSVTGGASYDPAPPAARITWSGTVNAGGAEVITFQVRVTWHGKAGPLPVVNTAQIYDGTTTIEREVTIYPDGYRTFLPLVARN